MLIKLQKGEKKQEIIAGHTKGQHPSVYSQQTVIILSALYTTDNAEHSEAALKHFTINIYIFCIMLIILFSSFPPILEKRGSKRATICERTRKKQSSGGAGWRMWLELHPWE